MATRSRINHSTGPKPVAGPASATIGWFGRNGARCAFTPMGPTPGPPPPCGMQNVLCRFRCDTSAPNTPAVATPTRALRFAPSGYTLPAGAWAKRFHFRPGQLDRKVGSLSGGEKARVVLARLMLDPADLLILDEPTNDLDIATLDVLEESLLEFPGALVLVTHDRYMLERISTSILALDGRGGCGMFADYAQWESSRREFESGVAPESDRSQSGRPRAKKLTYAEQKELTRMEEAVLEAETKLASAKARAEDPNVASDAGELHRRWAEVSAAQAEVDRLYARWSELEEKRAEAGH